MAMGPARAAPKVGPAAAKAAARPAPAVAPQVAANPGNNNRPRPSTADPSVPGGNMFRLSGNPTAGGDPYADLLAGSGDRRPSAPPRPPIRAEQK
jgi:hypothetical protein